jgi:hypothetical protein
LLLGDAFDAEQNLRDLALAGRDAGGRRRRAASP